jgi:uncharacterized protein YbbK (DUF523 family)
VHLALLARPVALIRALREVARVQKILVSACLLGERVRYDGGDSRATSDALARWQREGRLVSICPEVAGGLPVPRAPSEIQGGDGNDVLDGRAQVRNASSDVTSAYLAGAHQTLALAQASGARVAILKSRSPSCGNARIYDGTFTRTLRDGAGVTAALLARHGIAVFSEDQVDEAAAHLASLDAAR